MTPEKEPMGSHPLAPVAAVEHDVVTDPRINPEQAGDTDQMKRSLTPEGPTMSSRKRPRQMSNSTTYEPPKSDTAVQDDMRAHSGKKSTKGTVQTSPFPKEPAPLPHTVEGAVATGFSHARIRELEVELLNTKASHHTTHRKLLQDIERREGVMAESLRRKQALIREEKALVKRATEAEIKRLVGEVVSLRKD
jgi:hypothetical protein